MIKPAMLAVALLLVIAGVPIAQDSYPGFGQQPGIVQPTEDPSALNRRILSTTRYRLTPGDSYELVVILDTTERYPLLLTETYKLDVPYIGTLDVRGMTFAELKARIIQRIRARVPVQYVDFLLSAPALFDVFVYGGVKNPGIATVNPLSRVSDAILLAGGLLPAASFRTVQVHRADRTLTVDLSRYTAMAELDQNPLLEPGDKVFVPQADRIVEIGGRVRHPGTYELLSGETLEDLLEMAGGLTADAAGERIRIVRVQQGGRAQILQAALSGASGLRLLNQDRVEVESALANSAQITVDAAVYGSPVSGTEPTQVPTEPVMMNLPYTDGMTLLAVLDRLGGPTPLADLPRSMIRRGGETIDVDVASLWETRSASYDLALQPQDVVVVPMQRLTVMVAGEVNSPGSVPYQNGSKVSDYIMAAGGVNVDRGDINRIYFADESGGRRKVSLDTYVTDPGTLILVGRNTWTMTQKTFTDVLIVTGFIGALITFINQMISLVQRF